jgi:diacylglycerol kinase (ATP)
MRITLVHNPNAGSGDLTATRLRSLLDGEGHTVNLLSGKVRDLAAELAAEADLVVVAGGDGTVSKVLTALLGRDVPLALLPSGTANNIARSLGITGSAPISRLRLRPIRATAGST